MSHQEDGTSTSYQAGRRGLDEAGGAGSGARVGLVPGRGGASLGFPRHFHQRAPHDKADQLLPANGFGSKTNPNNIYTKIGIRSLRGSRSCIKHGGSRSAYIIALALGRYSLVVETVCSA